MEKQIKGRFFQVIIYSERLQKYKNSYRFRGLCETCAKPASRTNPICDIVTKQLSKLHKILWSNRKLVYINNKLIIPGGMG